MQSLFYSSFRYVIAKCANSKLSEYITFWVREFKIRDFKADRKSVPRDFYIRVR